MLCEVGRDRKLERCKFRAPILHDKRFPGRVFQSRSKCQPRTRTSDDTADREHAFRLAFPKKRAVEFWFADKRTRLIPDIDEIGRDHRQRKRDRDLVPLGDFSAGRINHDAAGIRFGIRCFLFLLFVSARLRQGYSGQAKSETAR